MNQSIFNIFCSSELCPVRFSVFVLCSELNFSFYINYIKTQNYFFAVFYYNYRWYNYRLSEVLFKKLKIGKWICLFIVRHDTVEECLTSEINGSNSLIWLSQWYSTSTENAVGDRKRMREVNFESKDVESGKWVMQSADVYSLLWFRNVYQTSLWPWWNIS